MKRICHSVWKPSACIKSPPPSCGASVVIRARESRRDETYTGDIAIFDVDGSPVAELTGFRSQTHDRRDFAEDDVARMWPIGFMRSLWKPLPLLVAARVRQFVQSGSYLILADDRGVGVKLRDMLAGHGGSLVFCQCRR